MKFRGTIAHCLICGFGPLILAASATGAESLSNPAAALCRADGANVVIETAPNGSQHGVCVFPSGERINEWAYFRNKHRTRH